MKVGFADGVVLTIIGETLEEVEMMTLVVLYIHRYSVDEQDLNCNCQEEY